jgi:acetoin utilization deacetylase AcuC-like enzyme
VESIGEGPGSGRNVNVNLPAGVGDPGYLDALDRIVVPILLEFRPELLIVACGVDANLFDPMARLGVTARGFAGVAQRLLAVADEVCGGRLVSVQEGGYSHVYAPFCWLAVIETIARLELHDDPWEDFIAGQPVCREEAPWHREANDVTRGMLAATWRSL